MTEPTPLDKPKPRVWECNCGNQTFFLYDDGQIQCASCENMHEEATGCWNITKHPIVREIPEG